MWDNTVLGEVGIPEIQSVCGFETPAMNKMAEGGINFMRMYTEPACTPTRAAFQTGRYAVRSGMHTVSCPVEYAGMDGDEVTIAEVMSAAGVKGRFKCDWKNAVPGLSKNEFYDLYTDPRERTGEMIEQFHVKSMFNRQRHEMWIKNYPNRPDATPGPALTGIELDFKLSNLLFFSS